MLNKNVLNTPLRFEKNNFKVYFQESIKNLKEKSSEFMIDEYINAISQKLEKISQNQNGKDFVDHLKNKPLFFSIVLIKLVGSKPALRSLKGKMEIAKKIFDGIFELAKNVVEHSSTKEGSIKIKSITEKTLKKLEQKKKSNETTETKKDKIRKEDEWKKNPELWTLYRSYISKQEQNKRYLEIDISDTGNVGIIESAIKELKGKQKNFARTRNAKKLYKEDIETIVKQVKSSRDEAKLLYDMYFNRGTDKTIELNTQSKNAYRGLGIYLFTKFVNSNHGIFNVQTNKYKEGGTTINFSSFGGDYQKSNFQSPEVFGTKYNIIIPIPEKHSVNAKKALNWKPDFDKGILVSKGVYEKMLPLKKEKNTEDYFLGGLNHLPDKYVLKNNSVSNNETFVFSIGTESLIDRTKIFRAISHLFDNDRIKSIIIKDISAELISGLFEIYEDFVFPSNSNELLILLIVKEDDENNAETRPTMERQMAIIAGNSAEQCRAINDYISKKDTPSKYLDLFSNDEKENERKAIENILQKHNLFDDKGELIAVDFFESIDQYFKDKVKPKLGAVSIEKDGYNWKKTHLKIGSKLHLDDFVYGKKMFQQSKEVSDFAFSLARRIFYKDIKENITEGKKVVYTIIGYGYYSELLVSQTRDFVDYLCKHTESLTNKPTIEYTIVKDEDEISFSRYIRNLELRNKESHEKFVSNSEEELLKHIKNLSDTKLNELVSEYEEDLAGLIRNLNGKSTDEKLNTLIADCERSLSQYGKNLSEERLIIVVPISSTLTTCLRIENNFEKTRNEKTKQSEIKKIEYNNDRFKIQQPFHTTVIVGHNIELDDLRQSLETSTDKKYDVVKKYWKKIEDKQIETHNREKNITRKNQFSVYIKSTWRQQYKCEHCFPKNPIQERPLFDTDKVSVTPNLVFDAPEWYQSANAGEHKPYPYFKFTNKDSNTGGDLPIIDVMDLDWVHYKSNSNKHFNYYLHYLDFINTNKKQLKRWTDEINKIDKFKLNEKEVLLIASDKAENGKFINLINREIFDNKASVIRFDKSSDHYLNFKKFFGNDINADKTIYFVDNLMLGGKTFKQINNTLTQLGSTNSIKGVFCLMNRMDFGNYTELMDCLGSNENFYSFVDLYVPESTVVPCPLCNEDKKYQKLIENASLDCIKQYYTKQERSYLKHATKQQLTENDLPYKPLKKSRENTLLKVALAHFLNEVFAKPHSFESIFIKQLKADVLPDWENGKDNDEFFKFNEFVNKFRKYIKEQKQCNIEDEIISDLKFKANLIKVLASQPFKKYRGIYISVFYWILNDLIIATKTILGSKYKYKSIKKQTDFRVLDTEKYDTKKYTDTVRYLRVLIKYAGSLNMAYLLHADFLAAISKLTQKFDNAKQDDSIAGFKLFCAAHIVRSLHNNEQRAIQFEKNINTVLEKEISENKNTSFLELLVLENTSIIRGKLKDKAADNNYDEFMDSSKHTPEIFKKTEELEKTLIIKEEQDSDSIEKEAKAIINKMTAIVGYEIEEENPKGGGLLLYRYQNTDIESNNYIVVANVGDSCLANLYAVMPKKCLAKEMLTGKTYLDNAPYTWTNYTVSFDEKNNEWIGQQDNGKKENLSTYTDIKNLDTEKVKRVLFVRISKFNKDDELKGDAVFVFYDNKKLEKNDYNSIHNIRFVYVLRKEFNDYFEKRYRNDTFRNWVEERKIHEDILSTEHHHKHQMKALYECAIGNPSSQKLRFHYDTIYDIKTIRDFMKNGDLSILNNNDNKIHYIEIKSQIDEYCEFILEPQVKSTMQNNIKDSLTIYFPEIIFRQIMGEYLENINNAVRQFSDTLGVSPTVTINAEQEDNFTTFTIENNFLMYEERYQKMQKINELGRSIENPLGGLPTNKKLLDKIGSEQLSVKMEETDIDGIGKFTVKLKIKNIQQNENN